MNIEKYEELTGTQIPNKLVAIYEAKIAQQIVVLESILGFTLDEDLRLENQYDEQGKSLGSCSCSTTGNLSPPDEIEFAYRLFPYNFLDRYLHTDPFLTLAKVKLVKNGVTIREFEGNQAVAQFKQGLAKYIEVCEDCFCDCSCKDCVQLAVDADWFGTISDGSVTIDLPIDLLYLLADMITYAVDDKKDVKSETLGSHRYEKFDKILKPYETPQGIATIKKYAGPYGSINKVITI